ncbi:MAG TPA: arginyltransferase [Gammaproteobacteria bacterium]|nr:arginyltransferase [Gammaproteobacteria bacterium]
MTGDCRTGRDPARPRRLHVVRGPEHPCGYLRGRLARNVYCDPREHPDATLHAELSEQGFRRSGPYLYRPHCDGCRACVATRIPVADFRPDRSQRRTWRRNRDLRVRFLAPGFREEHYRLYAMYTAARHPGGGMDESSREQYRFFIRSEWSDTALWEFRLGSQLLAVAVVDAMAEGLSAMYTFFDPHRRRRGLGIYAILYQIEEARRRGLPWLYLGFWIAGHAKMGYKTDFRPVELRTGQGWVRYGRDDPPPPRGS